MRKINSSLFSGSLPWRLSAQRFRIFVCIIISGFLSTTEASPYIQYHVKAGETLIEIGRDMLDDPAHWRELQRINRIKYPERIPLQTRLKIPVNLLRKTPLSGKIIAMTGNVWLNTQPASVDQKITAGANLKTDKNSYAIIDLPDGSQLRLPENSEIDIKALNGFVHSSAQNINIEVRQGRIESLVTPQKEAGSRYRIETPTALIGVRGTRFRVGWNARDTATQAEVLQGRIDARPPQKPPQTTPLIEAGYGVRFDQNGYTAPQKLLPPPDLSVLPKKFSRLPLNITVPQTVTARAWKIEIISATRDASNLPVLLSQTAAPGEKVRFTTLTDGHYRFRVRAIDSYDLEGLDAEHSFELAARPEPPFLAFPAMQQKVPEGAIPFRWSDTTQVSGYTVSISAQKQGSPEIFQQTTSDNTTKATLTVGHYRWKVASIDDQGRQGPWSDAQSFEVRPRQDIPSHSLQNNSLKLHWHGEPGQHFEYQLAKTPLFKELVANDKITTAALSLPRPAPDTYYLRVRAIDPDGFIGLWSKPQKIIIPYDAPSPWLLLTLLPLLAL